MTYLSGKSISLLLGHNVRIACLMPARMSSRSLKVLRTEPALEKMNGPLNAKVWSEKTVLERKSTVSICFLVCSSCNSLSASIWEKTAFLLWGSDRASTCFESSSDLWCLTNRCPWASLQLEFCNLLRWQLWWLSSNRLEVFSYIPFHLRSTPACSTICCTRVTLRHVEQFASAPIASTSWCYQVSRLLHPWLSWLRKERIFYCWSWDQVISILRSPSLLRWSSAGACHSNL